MRKGKHLIKSHMTLEYDFTGIRIQEGALTPVDWNLTVKLIAPDKKTRTKEESEYKANVTFQKLYFWLDTNLPNIVIADVNSEDDLYIANLSSNVMMYCPDVTADDVIIQLIHAKLATLSDGELIVGEAILKGSDTPISYTFDATGDYDLPTTTAEYYKEGTARDEIAWWFRNDGFCFEFIRPTGTEIADAELFNNIVDPMDEFNRVISEMAIESQPVALKEPARIVQIEKWKPRTV